MDRARRLLIHGTEHVIEGLEPMDAATGIAAFSPAQRRILQLLHRSHFVKFLEHS